MRTDTLLKILLWLVPAFLAGGLSYYSLQLRQDNLRLTRELESLQGLSGQLQAQQQLNTQQRAEFEGRIQQLETNLAGAQAQMTNLASALQEARELITPVPAPADALPVTATPAQ